MLTAATNCIETSSCPWFQLLVLLVLLIIGGIEINPGPNQAAKSRYKKTSGAADMGGELFEVKITALLFLRGLNSMCEFRIASNMAAAGSFDDLVFTLGDQTAFLQLKHRQRKNAKIYMTQLLSVKGDFSLLKYCKSYLNIKRQWQQDADLQHCGRFDDSLFIIFTNANLVGSVGSNVDSNRMLDLLKTQGKLFRFTIQQKEHIYEVFRNLPEYKQLLSKAISGEQISDTELLQVVQTLLNNNAECVPEKRYLVKLFADLESLGDLSGYTEFLSRLCFCTEQAEESELDNLIRSELIVLFANDAHFDKLMEGIQNWWRKSNIYLTVKAKFFQDILLIIAANITKNNSILKLKFVQNECDNIRQMFRCSNTKIYLKTDCTNLSCVKIVQSLETDLLVDVSTLQKRLSEVLAVWRLGVYKVLVVEGEATNTNILNKLASMPDPKCVVVISSKAEQTHLYQQFNFVSFTDTFCLSQLDAVSQDEVLEREVIFQGFPVKLNSLAETSFLQTAVTAEVVVQLHHTLQIGHKLVDLDLHYIPRTFLRREFVSEQIFREQNITFAVSETSEQRLAQLVACGEKVNKFDVNNFTKEKSSRYFILGGEDEFTTLCGFRDNVHWIQARAGDFIWKATKGDNISHIIKHLEQRFVSYSGAEKVLALSQQLVLLIAEPGMGKTTEMCNITRLIKQKDPSTWVIRVDLNQYITLLSRNQVRSMEFLHTVATLSTEFQKRLFEHQLQSRGNIAILVDGFDEINPTYSDRVFCLLRGFSKTKIKKIIVTSRPVMLDELQDKLSSLAFSFQVFTVDDQKNFLTKFWNHLFINSPELADFISSLLQLVGSSLDDKLKVFTGIPLQTRMLAEVFQDEASHYCQTGEVRLPPSLDVLNLYDKFIDKKWEVYCKKLNVDVKIAMLHELIQKQKLHFQQSHMICGIFSYLHEDYIRSLHSSEYILKQNKEFVQKFNSGEERTGIVSHITNDKAMFVHRTFTEYFVAKFFSNHFDLELNTIKKLYFDKNFECVQKFLDRIQAQELKLHCAVLNGDVSEVKKMLEEQLVDVNQKDKGGRTALLLAILNYCYGNQRMNDSIIETLLEHGADVNCQDKVFHCRPLGLAEKIKAWCVVEKLLEKQADNTDLVWIKANIQRQLHFMNALQGTWVPGFLQSVTSVLNWGMSVQYHMTSSLEKIIYTASCEGYVNLIEFILKCGVSVDHSFIIPMFGQDDKTTMLHIAAEHEQLRLVRFLIRHGAGIEVPGGVYNRTPLMQAVVHGHVQVAELLLDNGACVNAKDKVGYSAVLLSAIKGKCETVKLLFKRGAEVEISAGWYNRTPLMWAVERRHMHVAELLIQSGALVDARDKVGYTALSLAASEGKNEIVNFLLKKGADVEISTDVHNRTPLMCAVERSHMEVAELLIDNGACVNKRDKVGYTALALAASEGNYELVKLLLERRTDVEIPGGEYNRTPLMRAVECNHMQITELLIDNGAAVDSRDKVGYTALLLAAIGGYCEIVKLLLKKGANVEIFAGEYNRTPLMWAVECNHTQITELLIDNGACVNARDKVGCTALLLSAIKGKYEIVKLLLKRGADVEISAGWYNRTPLMCAVECNHMQVAELLVDNGALVDARDKVGYTALSLAASEGNYETVKFLLKNRADVEISTDVYNRTPLMCAVERSHMQVAELLIDNGALVDARDKVDYTALSLAASEGNYEIVNLLLRKGADVEIPAGEYNRTPLMWAVERNHVQVAELLIDNGACVNKRDKLGYTAVLLGAMKETCETMELLLKRGADVEKPAGAYNRTPLMWAAEYGHIRAVKCLIDNGACVNTRDAWGNTGLTLVADKGHDDITKLLLKNGAQ